MKSNVNKNIPVIFQNIKQYENEDERFVKVKIWLMHLGENLNGSVFNKESVEKALPSLANTPILAFIEENSMGELDYSDHRMVLHRDIEGEYSVKYLGQAVGLIPENNNAQWEMRVTDSGEELEYLTVEGLMWTKWDDPIDIIKRKGYTAQSMELSDKYTGTFNKDGLFEFDEFKFFGACLLGSDVMPAMKNSTVEMQFSTNDGMQRIIEDKLNEFNTLFSKEQGGNNLEENKQEFETEKETKEVLDNEESTENKVDETPADTTDEAKEEVSDEKTNEEFTEEAQEETSEEESVKEEVSAETTDVENEVDEPQEEQVNEFEVKFNDLTEKFNSLQSELEDLRSFKRETLEKELSAKFEGQLTDEELAQVFEQSKDSTIEDIEKELFALVGKKNFSAFSVQPTTKIAVEVKDASQDVVDEPYGGLFSKHLKK